MSLKNNFLYNIAYQILIMILPLITAPYLARVIGAEGIGIYSYSYSIVNYFMLFSLLGLNNYGSRSIAEVRDDKYKLSKQFFSLYGLQCITSFLMMTAYLLYIVFGVTQNKTIYYIQLLLIFSSFFDINWFFFGIEQFKTTVTRNTIIKLLTLVLIFAFVKKIEDLWIYTLIMAGGTFLSQLVLWHFLKKYVVFVKVSFKEIIIHLKPSLILFVPVLAVSIYKIMDKIMLGSMTDMLQVGYYENAEKIINIPMGIIAALGTVMLPRMANLNASGNHALSRYYIETSLKFIMFISIGMCIGIIGISSSFIPLFFGEQFISTIPIAVLLSCTIVFISWATVIRTQFLIPVKKDKIYIKSTILGAILNVIINILLIPKYGATGAALGTIIAELSVAIYQTFMVKNDLDIIKYLKNTSLFIIPAFIMYFFIESIASIVENQLLQIIIQVIGGGCIYLIMSSFSIYIFDKNQYNMIGKLYLKKNK